ncbi:hypothetical protein N8966_04380 [Candidatus Pelagibacter ubique]|nr:hypothetical protein [Candidatus Pelagibacter ubique]
MFKKISTLNYGSGNNYSLACALRGLDIDLIITDEKKKFFKTADKFREQSV